MKKTMEASKTHISDLADDVLGDIFLRLPSVASITRAAFACRNWRSVVSSPDFHLRVRHAHRWPPLLSFVSPDFSFHPVDPVDPGLIACLRRSYISYWRVRDCRDGLVIIISSQDSPRPVEMMMVYDPMSGRFAALHRPPPQPTGGGSGYNFSDCLLPAAAPPGHGEKAALSFRVASVQYQDRHLRAAVYDSDAAQWTFHAWVCIAPPPTCSRDSTYASPMHAAGCVYWKYPAQDNVLCLHTQTMGFSVVPLPASVSAATPYAIGETKDAECCLVAFVPDPLVTNGQMMQVWIRRGHQHWEMQRQVSLLELENALPCPVLHVRTVATGVVLVSLKREIRVTLGTTAVGGSMDHVAFCVESFQVQARFKSAESVTHPYQMPWPAASLLG